MKKFILVLLFVIFVLVFLWIFIWNKTTEVDAVLFEGRGEQAIVDSPKSDVVLDRGQYIFYTDSTDLSSISGKKVLFFYADWYPESKKIDEQIINSISEIPVGINIIRVDFDNSLGLKEKYEIKNQQTFVLLDSGLRSEKIWIDYDFNSLIQNIK